MREILKLKYLFCLFALFCIACFSSKVAVPDYLLTFSHLKIVFLFGWKESFKF